MSANPVQSLTDAALALTPEQKIQLAETLLASLDPPDQAEIDAAWAEECERRIKEVDAGRARLIPAEEVFAELERRKRL